MKCQKWFNWEWDFDVQTLKLSSWGPLFSGQLGSTAFRVGTVVAEPKVGQCGAVVGPDTGHTRPAPYSPSQPWGRGLAAPAPMLRLRACVRDLPFALPVSQRPGGSVSAGLDHLSSYPEGTTVGTEDRIGPNRDRGPTLTGNPGISPKTNSTLGHTGSTIQKAPPRPGRCAPPPLPPPGGGVVRPIGIVGGVVREEVRSARAFPEGGGGGGNVAMA